MRVYKREKAREREARMRELREIFSTVIAHCNNVGRQKGPPPLEQKVTKTWKKKTHKYLMAKRNGTEKEQR